VGRDELSNRRWPVTQRSDPWLYDFSLTRVGLSGPRPDLAANFERRRIPNIFGRQSRQSRPMPALAKLTDLSIAAAQYNRSEMSSRPTIAIRKMEME